MAKAAKDVELGLRWVPLGEVEEWESNPRYNDEAVEPVAASILRFGFVAPAVVWASRARLVAGHTRIRAVRFLQERQPTGFADDGSVLGWEPREGAFHVPAGYGADGAAIPAPAPDAIPVRWQEFRSEAEADAYGLADNKLNELAQWEDSELADVMRGLDNLGGLGWEASELDALLNPASLDDVNFKTFDETIGDGASGGKQVTCPSCQHQFKV